MDSVFKKKLQPFVTYFDHLGAGWENTGRTAACVSSRRIFWGMQNTIGQHWWCTVMAGTMHKLNEQLVQFCQHYMFIWYTHSNENDVLNKFNRAGSLKKDSHSLKFETHRKEIWTWFIKSIPCTWRSTWTLENKILNLWYSKSWSM
jgi:hypothetical protein